MAALTPKHKCYLHNKTGSTIAELPPSLLILLVVIFFPMLNLIYLFLAYCAGWYLNEIEMRQISYQAPIVGLTGNQSSVNGINTTAYANSAPCNPNNSATTSLPQSQAWHGFMGVTEAPDSPKVVYLPLEVVNTTTGQTQTLNQVGKAQVTTSVSIAPFLSTTPPWLPHIPGLTAPFDVSYTNTIFQEEQSPPPPVINKGN